MWCNRQEVAEHSGLDDERPLGLPVESEARSGGALAMAELLLMLSIPPLVGVLAYAAVRWRWAKQEQARQAALREPRMN